MKNKQQSRFSLVLSPEWGGYGTSVAKGHLHDFGMVILDGYGAPDDDAEGAEKTFRDISGRILGRLSDAQVEYCAGLGKEISEKMPEKQADPGRFRLRLCESRLDGFLDAAALEKNLSGEEKQWLCWYFTHPGRCPAVPVSGQRHRTVRKPARIEVPAGGNTFLVAEENTDPGYREIFIGLEAHDGQARTWIQNIAVAGQDYIYQSGRPVSLPGTFSLKVWGDSENEDFTDDFIIRQAGLEETGTREASDGK